MLRLPSFLTALSLARAAVAGAPFALAPPDAALTIAFAAENGARQAYLVASAGEDALEAIALGSGDAFAALEARTPDELAALVASGPRTRLPLAALLPVIEGAQHVAGGANYPEHGAEVDVDAPFLFPKIAAPTPWQGQLATRPDWLLDYEVEIAVVFDRELASPADLEAARVGVFLVNDFTERAQLTREADLAKPGIGGGFANAKGKPGFLPTGPFLTIPRDWRAFVRDCEIRLHVNGAERQLARGGQMIWSVDELVGRTLALAGQPHFTHEERRLALTVRGLPRGTAILTGTPGGVAFSTPSTGFIAASAALWLTTFRFLGEDAETFVKRRWTEELRRRGTFLRGGDVVIAEGAGLGTIVTHIESAGR